jgi:hypothetical protein
MPIKDLLAKLKALPAVIGIFFKKPEKLAGADIPEKLSGFKGKLRDLFGGVPGFLGRVPDLFGKAPQFVRVSGKKERLLAAGSLIAVFVLILCIIILLAGKSGRRRQPELSGAVRIVIPPEDLFMPEEPDFAPGILLERERRASWTAEDAAPFWQDPLKNGEEQWRKQVEALIDELMERVP